MQIARSIGLVPSSGEVSGTIKEDRVLGTLAELGETEPEHADLFADAAARVRRARSAGVEQFTDRSRQTSQNDTTTIQLRYRSEMLDIFTDLAIDVGMRQHSVLADASP